MSKLWSYVLAVGSALVVLLMAVAGVGTWWQGRKRESALGDQVEKLARENARAWGVGGVWLDGGGALGSTVLREVRR